MQSIVTVAVWRGEELSASCTTVVDGDVIPLTLTAAPEEMLFWGATTGEVVLVEDSTTAKYGGEPPVPTNGNELAGTQLFLAIAPGVTTSADGGGSRRARSQLVGHCRVRAAGNHTTGGIGDHVREVDEARRRWWSS